MKTTIRCSCGRTAVLTDKREVFASHSEVAALVAHAHAEGHDLTDLCRGPVLPQMLTKVLLAPDASSGSRRPSFHVASVRGHSPSCPCVIGSHRGTEREDSPSLVYPETFARESVLKPTLETDFLDQPEPSSANLADFGCWCSEAISRVTTRAFGISLPGQFLTPHSDTTPTLAAIAERLASSVFTTGQSVGDHLRANGQEIAVGVTQVDAVRAIDRIPEFRRFWFNSEASLIAAKSLTHIKLSFDHSSFSRVHGRARSQSGYHAAPYFYVALGVCEAGQFSVHRSYFHPVAQVSGELIFTESDVETRSAHAIGSDTRVFKPMRLTDLNSLLTALSARGLRWPPTLAHRPDWLVCGQRILALLEVAGRKDQPYRCDLLDKVHYYASLEECYDVRSVVIEPERAGDREWLWGVLGELGVVDPRQP